MEVPRSSCAEQPSLALVVYENGRMPAMLAREDVIATVAVATTRNLPELAQREGLIPDAGALWAWIAEAASPRIRSLS